MDCSPPGSSIQGILQKRVLEWVAISFSRGSSWPRDWTWVSSIEADAFTVWANQGSLLLSVLHLNSTKLLDWNLPRPHTRGPLLWRILICALYSNQASWVSCFPKFCESCQGVLEPERAASLCSLLVRSLGGLGALELVAGVWSGESLLKSEVCAHSACSVWALHCDVAHLLNVAVSIKLPLVGYI